MPTSPAIPQVHGTFSADRRALALTGRAESADAGPLTMTLVEWHRQLVHAGAREATLCLWGLEVLNARAAESFAVWLGELQRLDAAGRYRVLIVGNAERPWHQACLRAIASHAPHHVSLRFDGPRPAA